MNTPNPRLFLSAFELLVAATIAAILATGCAKSPSYTTSLPGQRPNVSGSGATGSGILSSFVSPRRAELAELGPGADELWVVARSSAESATKQDNNSPGCGEMLTTLEGEQQLIPLPLKHTDVRASVSGFIGTVDVTQQFANPYDKKIEAVYVFPLPHNAAVSEFVMTIGERRIRGIIRERKEAEQIYAAAKSQGYTASLLTEERPNIFNQSVANIEPGKQIDVNLKYFETLSYADGWYEFVFPMVVGPRYNPAGLTNGVGAVARGQAGVSGQSTEVQYLKPTERSGHDISLRLDVDAGVNIEEYTCATHRVVRQSADAGRLSVALADDDRVPNRDFVLRYRVAGERIKSNLITRRDERGGYFALMLFPPQELENLVRAPMEMVFVLDCSGSMSGRPIEQAKTAIRHALQRLRPADSFQIINFSEHASRLGTRPLEATPANIERGMDYISSLNGDGPTEMIEGIKAALDFPHDPERLRFVCFLTDGYIGNEAEILAAVHGRLGESRIFSFGVGSSPNRYLLDHMAKQGRGAVAELGLNDDGGKVMDDFFNRISHPALTNLRVDWGGLQVSELYPQRLPDLFVGRPVVLTGRFAGTNDTEIHIHGRAGLQPIDIAVPVKLSSESGGPTALPNIWARSKIADLADRSTYEQDAELPLAIKHVALDYGIMSAFTAFIAVDSSRVTEGDEGVTVPVAVPVPKGVNYNTTVKEEK